ncbi:MAG: hypothetical protein N2039_00455, partial [Gemmataceae bacterium]|nr:hypothetical protein [Gemmataceae bacterium]
MLAVVFLAGPDSQDDSCRPSDAERQVRRSPHNEGQAAAESSERLLKYAPAPVDNPLKGLVP